jgi:putative protease
MKTLSYANSLQHCEQLANSSAIDEVVLSISEFSRYGKLPKEDIQKAISILKDKKLSIQLDRILTESEFTNFISDLKRLGDIDNYSFRVIDPGIAQYLIENTKAKIQWIAEMGNHNLKALVEWEKHLGEQLERIILCPELESNKIKEFAAALKTETELLVFGPILLFYTPRHLLSPYYEEHDDPVQKQQLSSGFLEISANSEESPHKGFPIIETKSGTYMFNPKDLCVLDYYQDIIETGVDNIRIDFRSLDNMKPAIEAFEKYKESLSKDVLQDLKSLFPRSFIRGFFKANKSDVLFKNLKNTYNLRADENYLGDVLETESGSHCVLEIKSTKRNLNIDDEIQYKTPDKKWKSFRVKQIKNMQGDTLETATAGDFIVLPHSGGVSSNTRVYWK